MKFLKQSNPESKKKEDGIQVKKVIEVTVQCDCGFWGKMKGGEVEDGKAVFQCPECQELNWVKWFL